MTQKEETFLKAIEGRDIYTVDNDGNIKINGYYYSTDEGRRPWRVLEMCWCQPDMQRIGDEDYLSEYESSCNTCIGDMTATEVLQQFAVYFDGTMPEPVPMTAANALLHKGEHKAFIDAGSLPEFPYGCLTKGNRMKPGIFGLH